LFRAFPPSGGRETSDTFRIIRHFSLAPLPLWGCTMLIAIDRCRPMEYLANSCALRETPATPAYMSNAAGIL